MNRRNFFKGIAALPLAVVAPKALPAPEPARTYGHSIASVYGERSIQVTFVLPPTSEEIRETVQQIVYSKKRK